MKARAAHVRHCLTPPVAAFHMVLVSVFQVPRPNGITTTWSYEQNRDLVTQVQNGTVSTYGYVNDAIGRRTSMSHSGSAYANPDTIAYTYNDRSELTGASSNVDATYSYSYAYDPIGNRTTASEAGVPWTYATNSLNQYTSATENNTQLSFAYDLDGSMTYRPVDATSGWTQIWNGENRMVETYKGTDRLTFKYDYMGRRVEKCVYSGNTLTAKTLFVYDGFKCVEELDGLNGNAVAMRHAWQPFDVGLDVILATTDGNEMSYFLHDANKNVMQKTDSNGVLREGYAYAPFGKLLGSENHASIGFSSECHDGIINTIYYKYRYLISAIGRWSAIDPIEENGGSNLVFFYHNDTVNFWDHLGNACCNKQKYNSSAKCCCKDGVDTPGAEDADLVSRKKVETGVIYYCRYTRYYYIPLQRPWSIFTQTFLMHCWFHYDGKAYGAYPNGKDANGHPTGGVIEEQSKYIGTEGSFFTIETKVKLSPCKYKISVFKSCVDSKMPDPMFNWTPWNNCKDFVLDTISECKKKSEGCEMQ